MPYLIVFVGAGIGGALRHAVNLGSARVFGDGFPAGTLIVNVFGSFLIGLLAGYFAAHGGVNQHMRLLLATGVLGGFTTFSAFSLDVLLLVDRQALALAAVYVGASVALSLLGTFAGLLLFRAAV